MIFDWQGANELGVTNDKVKKVNLVRFQEALSFCHSCPVRQECNDDAVYHGDTTHSVRGGLTPYDRPERAGYPVGESTAALQESLEARLAIWNAFEEGRSHADTSHAARDWLQGTKRALAETPHTAEWDTHKPGGLRLFVGGSGWAISQDMTRSFVKLMYRTGPGLTTRVAASSKVRYDKDSTPRTLRFWSHGLESA